MEGYTFLMQNYHDGDKICMFRFSWGAYTARALSSMLFKVHANTFIHWQASNLIPIPLRLDSFPKTIMNKFLLHTSSSNGQIRQGMTWQPDSNKPLHRMFLLNLWVFGRSLQALCFLYMTLNWYNRDTVASTGGLWSKTLPFTNSNSSIRTFWHALSLDEVRFSLLFTTKECWNAVVVALGQILT